MRILIFSSVCKSLEIFEIAFKSYFFLNRKGFEIDYLFFDDNNDPKTKEYLKGLESTHENVHFLDYKMSTVTEYINHDWNRKKIDRIIDIKNAAIEESLKKGYDYLFLVDSDLVLHPNTLVNLVESKKDFIFNIFWTRFREDAPYTPNAWDFHSWGYHNQDSYFRLKRPDVHLVGGGGACTLLSYEILNKGLNFNRLLSLHYQGEDRHFCTRAQSLGYDLFVDSRLPAYHIFQDHMASEARVWYEKDAFPSFFDNWLNEKWELEVNKIFNPEENFVLKLKKFLTEIRKSFNKHFLN
jgi:hypothetical protein